MPYTRTPHARLEIHVYDAGAHRLRIVDERHTWILDKPRAWAIMDRTQRLTWIGRMIDSVEPSARAA